jgi:protein tyrosine/serine phosphatase
MHCKSGADRAGIASCLYLIYKHKYSVLDATKQLSFKYLHIKYAKTGILDYLFETAIKKGKYSSSDFINWIDNDYSNQKLKKSFKPYKLFDFIVEKILKRE